MLRRETRKWLDERALGMEAEMIFGMRRMRYARTYMGRGGGAYRIRPTAMNAKNHCSGQPDGAAANNSDDGGCDGLTLFCDAWKRRPLNRAGTPK